MFHKIGEEDGEFNISVSEFQSFVNQIKSRNVIRLEDWENHWDFVALTFDDVPESFYYKAYPILIKYNLPFCLFVNVSLLDKPGYITTSQLNELSKCNLCTIGSHGISHDAYRKFSKNDAVKDLATSKKILESLTGLKVDMFAFPYGSYSACGFLHKKLVADFYKYGFSTIAIPVSTKHLLPSYFLPRINYSGIK